MLNKYNTNGKPDTIRALEKWPSQPRRFDNVTTTTASGSRWGARLGATSSTVGGAGLNWGSDGATAGFMWVATGSSVAIAKSSTENAVGVPDHEDIMYKIVIPSGVFQPTGIYKSVVTFTISDNP
jgi:hypothetical protein